MFPKTEGLPRYQRPLSSSVLYLQHTAPDYATPQVDLTYVLILDSFRRCLSPKYGDNLASPWLISASLRSTISRSRRGFTTRGAVNNQTSNPPQGTNAIMRSIDAAVVPFTSLLKRLIRSTTWFIWTPYQNNSNSSGTGTYIGNTQLPTCIARYYRRRSGRSFSRWKYSLCIHHVSVTSTRTASLVPRCSHIHILSIERSCMYMPHATSLRKLSTVKQWGRKLPISSGLPLSHILARIFLRCCPCSYVII